MKELNEAIQGLKMEVETIKETQMEASLEMENLGKRTGITGVIITNIMQEREERILGVEDILEEIESTVNANSKHRKLLIHSIYEIQDTIKRPNLIRIGIEDSKHSQLKRPENIFNKIIEENLPNMKKEISRNVQEAYGTPNNLDKERKF